VEEGSEGGGQWEGKFCELSIEKNGSSLFSSLERTTHLCVCVCV